MIPEIKKILYTTDLSPNSAYAFRYAINSAKKHDATIIILHVVEEIAPFFQKDYGKWMRELPGGVWREGALGVGSGGRRTGTDPAPT